VKLPTLSAEPAGVVTEIFPVVAPPGTVTRIRVGETTVIVVVLPLPRLTDVAPLKPEPEIETSVTPTWPLLGVKLVILGRMVKESALVPVPAEVVTLMAALTAVVGTVILIEVGERSVNPAAIVPILTEVTAVKFVPVMVMLVPAWPLAGVKPDTVGDTANEVELVRVVLGVLTVIVPVTAPTGTITVSLLSGVSGSSVKLVVLTVPNLTSVAPVKPEPETVTVVPTGPFVGVKLPMPCRTVKLLTLAPVPA
jgi:hypothetical protein